MRRTFELLLFTLLVLGMAVTAHAQSTTATIRGTVKDATGNPVAGAEINAVSATTGHFAFSTFDTSTS